MARTAVEQAREQPVYLRLGWVVAFVLAASVLSWFLAGLVGAQFDWSWFDGAGGVATMVATAQVILAVAVFLQIAEARHQAEVVREQMAQVDEHQRADEQARQATAVADFVAACANAVAQYEGMVNTARRALEATDATLVEEGLHRIEPYRQQAHAGRLRVAILCGETSPSGVAARQYANGMDRKRSVLTDTLRAIAQGNAGPDIDGRLMTRLDEFQSACIQAAQALISTPKRLDQRAATARSPSFS